MPYELSHQQRKKFLADVKYYFWEDPFLYKHYLGKIIRRCVLEEEMTNILSHCHSFPYGDHFRVNRTTTMVLQSGFHWPSLFKDSQAYVATCDGCQKLEKNVKKT